MAGLGFTGMGAGSAVGAGADVGAGIGVTTGVGDGVGIEQAASVTKSMSSSALSRRIEGTLQERLPRVSTTSRTCTIRRVELKYHW